VATRLKYHQRPFIAFKIEQKRLASGPPPQTPLGELIALPRPVACGEGRLAQITHFPPRPSAFSPAGLRLRPFGPRQLDAPKVKFCLMTKTHAHTTRTLIFERYVGRRTVHVGYERIGLYPHSTILAATLVIPSRVIYTIIKTTGLSVTQAVSVTGWPAGR